MNDSIGTKGKILIVEDDLSIQKLLREILKAQFPLEFAHCGLQGLALYHRENFCLIVTDINLPGVDGHSIARHVKERTPKMPIIGMSGRPFEETTNFCCTFEKPFNVERLVNTVRLLSKPNHTCIKNNVQCLDL